MKGFPRRIVCLTEESVETLFKLGKGGLIKGVSCFVKRPLEATNLPKVTQFTNANIQKIVDLKPDLVLGYSDIQKDIAAELIGLGLNVYVANHRDVQGILEYIVFLGSMVNARSSAENLVHSIEQNIEDLEKSKACSARPSVYFEEWDEPMITGIKWVSEVIQLAGGRDIFEARSKGVLAKDRFVSSEEVCHENPDLIIGCWCGKKVRLEQIKARPGWDKIKGIKNQNLVEVEPEIFLQPGPAVLTDGLAIMAKLIHDVNL